jgi:fatty acid desaturase
MASAIHTVQKEKLMKANVGGIDKVLSIVVGLGVLSLLAILDGSARWWGLIGLVPLSTTLLGWCPAYTLLGINTCPVKQ